MELHKKSGYLPITKAAYEKTKASGYYKEFPYLETPLLELTNKEPTENSRGLRLGNMVQLRDVWAEEIEAALAGKKTAKQALDDAVARGNQMLRQFERTVSAVGTGFPLPCLFRHGERARVRGSYRRPSNAAAPHPDPLVWRSHGADAGRGEGATRGIMEKRAIFGGKMLPYLLLGPQLLVTLVFFYWPASQAVWQSFLLQDAFGLQDRFHLARELSRPASPRATTTAPWGRRRSSRSP